MRKATGVMLYSLLSVLMCAVAACGSPGGEKSAGAEALCAEIAACRYRDVGQMEAAALRLDTLAAATDEQRSVARNALAYAALMRMDYSAAEDGYLAVIDGSRCEVERLVADVGLMMLSFRTSANRAFFDYRSRALGRVRRINEEEGALAPDDRKRFTDAKVELAAVSLCYFANLGMNDEAERAAAYLERNIAAADSLVQRLYGRLTLNYRTGLPLLQRAEALLNVLGRSQREGQLWIVANSRLMLSVLLRGDEARGKVVAAFPSRIRELCGDTLDTRVLPYTLSVAAARDFERYGDAYMAVEALSAAASCATQTGEFELSIALLDDALQRINGYYQNFYPHCAFEPLVLDDVDEEAERRRVESDSVANICECMLSVRREASCAYAGIGNKYASDVNRNAYLDLLRSTRLNKQTESRMAAAQQNATRLYVWLVVSVLLVVAVVVVALFLNVRWKRRNAAYAADLERLLKVCRRLMSSMPNELPDAAAVHAAVCDILNNGLRGFSGDTAFSLLLTADGNVSGDRCCLFPLVLMDGTSQWTLCVETEFPLSGSKRLLLGILLPYVAVAIEEGMRVVGIGDERSLLQQKQESYAIYLASHKRENVIKRVSLSVVNGMQPYINRILNELRHLSVSARLGEGEQRRLGYVAELIAVLDEYNGVLERWIKTRQGELSLHIESFSLGELFAILRNSTQGFLLKGIDFCVKDTEAVVKADKALTLFMINTLADNAGKFTPRGGCVTVEAVEADDYVEVAVSDTGCGMSGEDIGRILNNKVYDASLIGGGEPLSTNKGSGFGLMNCKGIIEKYRKSDSLFSVCSLDISSEKGKGSRFSFRLPKGVVRMLAMLLMALLPFAGEAKGNQLARVGELADSVYSCNVEGRHAQALHYAAEAVALFNEFYRTVQPEGVDTLAFSSGSAAELGWWRSSLFPDSLVESVYYNLLDIRNEAAVAALAEHEWQLYRYNNSIYTQLYRMVHEDRELLQHYERMQGIANYRYAAVAVCVALLILLLVMSVIMYMRRVVLQRMNTGILLDVNARLLNVARGGRVTGSSLAGNIAAEVYAGTHEYLRVRSVAVLFREGATVQAAAAPGKIDRRTTIFLSGILESEGPYVSNDGRVRVLPLVAKAAHEEKRMGVLYLELDRALTASEAAMLELVASYAASAAYYSIVSLELNYRSLDDVGEEAERLKYEENYMHVRNMVIDNCLSMIKHETIYYPPRIGALVEKLRTQDLPPQEWCGRVAAVKELMTYYNEMFGILSRCASRQLDDTSFAVSQIRLDEICARMQRRVANKARRSGANVALQCSVEGVVACGDAVLVEFLFGSLLDALLVRGGDGELRLTAVPEGRLLRVEILDTRSRLTAAELAAMFVPAQGAASLEYLIVKEIVRMHEDYMDIRGSRVEAHDSPDGTVVLFTLPQMR
ncbi:MAG: DUF5113 domain-containing protein [Bacteroidaceae bacterium]|nr:DUF5113 domain-containing protein [Bacteroidaceae bacterium]